MRKKQMIAMLLAMALLAGNIPTPAFAQEAAETILTEEIPVPSENTEELPSETLQDSLSPEGSETTQPEELHQHAYEPQVIPPTCTEKGYTTYACTCGDSYVDDYVEAEGAHEFTDWYTTKEAAYNADGEQCRDCKKCSHVEFQSVSVSVVTSGNFGKGTTPTDKATYTLYSDGTMVIAGEGALYGTSWRGDDQPFLDYRKQVKHLIIEEGITTTTSGSLVKLSNLETVQFPSTMTRLPQNALMSSFRQDITRLTIPATVVHLGAYSIGHYTGDPSAHFTDVILENPNIQITDHAAVFNGGEGLERLTLYSYGNENKVQAYADKYGIRYIDLNNYFTGTFGDIAYMLYDGTLTLSAQAQNVCIPAEDQPWQQYRDQITTVEIGRGITAIAAEAFLNYSALTSVQLTDDLRSIGDNAFAVTEGNGADVTITIPRRVESLGKDLFAGRKQVKVFGYYDSPAEHLTDSNIQLDLKKQFKLLLIGNSYSEDASNGTHTKGSQLLDILQAMLGQDAQITVALLSSGGKGMHWHATQAEQGNTAYSFKVITTENPIWKSMGSYTSAAALAWTDWDAVSLQPYNINVSTGQESVPYPASTDPKFYHIEASSSYMLDHVDRYAPYADIYFYMHWAQTSSTVLNAVLSSYNKNAAFMPQVLEYAGTKSGAQFKTIIPVGLSIQNARTTYLALLRYNTTAYADGNLNLTTDAQIGLQRDGGHVSFNIGRYIAALTFAETIVPQQMRSHGYVLPDIRVTESVGKLPKEYSVIAQKSVLAAVDSWNNGSLAVTNIDGYTQDPTVPAKQNLEAMTWALTCAREDAMIRQIRETVLAELPADFVVDAVAMDRENATATITIRFGYTSVEAKICWQSESHAYEDGICTGCGAEEVTAQPMSLRYDDHYDVTGKTVQILDAGAPTSYQVGYGVEENKVLDTAVVTLKGNTLAATGIGTAKVKIDDILYEITVEAAPISLLLLIGQSNMQGIDGNAGESIVCPTGQVYATYADRYKKTVEDVTKFAPGALTGEHQTVNVTGDNACLENYPVNMLTEAGNGREGMDSGIAYEWTKQTGEKVWTVNVGYGGSSIKEWQEGGVHYQACLELFQACQDTLRKEIAAGHFTLSHMAYFWCQGCADENQTAEWYVDQFLTMHDTLKTNMAFDKDTTFEFAGIVPIRSGHNWVSSYRAGAYKDSTNVPYYQSFKDLQFNGPRVAQYWMGNNPELSDIWNVCTIQEGWATLPDGTDGVADYFESAYKDGIVDYPTQVTKSDSWRKPTTPAAVHDNIHYNQIGYNELGRESARNALILLGEISAPNVTPEVKFLTWDGFTSADTVIASPVGVSGTLVVPMVCPVWKSKDVTYTVSEGLRYAYYDLLAETVRTEGTLTASNDAGTITVAPRELTSFRWELDGNEFANLIDDNWNENAIAKLAGSVTNGIFSGVRYKMDKAVQLLHNETWCVEIQIENWTATAGSMILSSNPSAAESAPYFYFRPADFFVGIGCYNGSTYDNYGISLKNHGIACSEGVHTYQFVNRISDDGTNMIYLIVDNQEIGALTDHYINSTLTDSGNTWLSGKDFSMPYFGTTTAPISNCTVNYIAITENNYNPDMHLHDWSGWELVRTPSCDGPGEEKRVCSGCGETQSREVEGVWQKYHLDAHMTDLPAQYCGKTNLWPVLPHDVQYYHSGVRWDTNGNVRSVTFAVSGGERMFATSFGKRGTNGSTSSDGIRLTFFGEDGVLKTTSPQETYAEFAANGGYVVVPEGAVAVNVPMYDNSEANELYILNREHTYGPWQIIKAATAAAEGQEQRSCVCGDVQTRKLIPVQLMANVEPGKVTAGAEAEDVKINLSAALAIGGAQVTDLELEYSITDETGKVYSLEEALKTPGKYTIVPKSKNS